MKFGRKRWYGKLDWDEWYEDVIAPVICKIFGHKRKEKFYDIVCSRCYVTLGPNNGD